ncbi:2,3,4,5-tetrahydropyridine-2,6-dicarboxylate N-succinyltransferase [Candidatus Pelagibacter sp.]|nr:2,3,4,5-tetrahydropyridine-2,6-dicarboxylate N-succinyltransferase [Candidatus Pelagibacter sp.]
MSIEEIINEAWKIKDQINKGSDKSIIDAINETIHLLNEGKITVAEPNGNDWKINDWIQKGILLSFRVNDRKIIGGPYNAWNDFSHLPGKTAGWTEKEFAKAGFRMVPNSVVRNGSFIGKGAVIMPNSFINIGGYCGENSMVDTGARIGSAARLGANCHLSAGCGLGGILEPIGSKPTIIEDNCFIGALSEIVEGVIVRKGSVVSMGCTIGRSTKIVSRKTGEITSGEVPAGSVVVPGSLPSKEPGGPNLYCVVIIKTVDEKTRSKTSLNDLLRD